MKYFIGIVPPKEIYDTLLHIQTQFGDNRVEPHITLRPPVKPQQTEEWLSTIDTVAATIKPFTIALPGTGYFGKRVLYVSVAANDLIELYKELIPALWTFEDKKDRADLNHFHPHLTLGRNWCGFTADDFKQMQHLADSYLTANSISFNVTHIRIYQKPENGGRWQCYKDVPLG